MSHFNHLVVALPIERTGILAAQAGIAAPKSINFDDTYDETTPSGQFIAALSAHIKAATGLEAEVFTNFEYDEDDALYGVELGSTYGDSGISEARSAQALFGGYRITPQLWARAQAIKAALVKALPGFAAADLQVILQHW